MSRLLRGGLAAALVLFLMACGAASVLAADWTDFGGTPERQHRSLEEWTVPAHEGWRILAFAGVSRSQPLVVGGKLYHLAANPEGVAAAGAPAGAWLYGYDLASLPGDYWSDGWLPGYRLARANADPGDARWADGHLTYDPGAGAFYWGTADGCLAAWRPGMPEPVFEPLYWQRPGDTRIVSAPLVLSPGVVAVGAAPAPGSGRSHGTVCVLKGLLGPGRPVTLGDAVPAAVTSSFVRIAGDRFLVGVDGLGGRGEVRCYQVTADGLSLVTRWGANGRIVTPAGVPASFAVEGPYFYFSDKYGTFYKAELATGKVVWSRRFGSIPVTVWPLAEAASPELRELALNYDTGPRQVEVRGDRLFVNSSPAVGDRYVYFTVRTEDRTASEWTNGLLLALDKGTGDVCWAVRLPGCGNVCPLVWERARRVLVGDTNANLTCWDMDTGKPRALSLWREEVGLPGDPLASVWLGGVFHGEGLERWQQIPGASVELTLADGYLVAGGNWTTALRGEETGDLAVLKLAPPLNLRLRGAAREPSGVVEPGRQVTVKATVELAQGDSAVDTWVGWRWKGEIEWRKVQDVTLGPDCRQVEVSFQVSAPSATRTLEVKVNPDELHPATETDYRDNAAEVVVEVKESEPPLDLALAMVYPKELWAGMVMKVFVDTWTAQGPGAATEVVFTVNGKSASKRVTLPAGKPGAVVRAEFGVEALSPGTLHLQAVVNPGRNPAEVRYDNNRYAADVPVHGLINPPGDGEVRVWLIR